MQDQKTLALFDLDHTLLDVDSDYLWGEYIVRKGLVNEAAYRQKNQQFYDDYIAGTLDATEYNEFVAQFLTTMPIEQLHNIRADYIDSDIMPHIRPLAINAIKRHVDADDDVVIISATNDFVVSAIAKRFGVKSSFVLATPLEIKDNRYTGKLCDKPNFQDGKIYHLNKWLDQRRQAGVTYSKTYAYSDSKNDLPLLKWADIAIAVTPDEILRDYALTQDWTIEDWSI